MPPTAWGFLQHLGRPPKVNFYSLGPPLPSRPSSTSTSEDEPFSPPILGGIRRRKWWPRMTETWTISAHQNASIPPPNTNHTFNAVHRPPLPPSPLPPKPTSGTSSSPEAQIESPTGASASTTSSASTVKSTQKTDNSRSLSPGGRHPCDTSTERTSSFHSRSK